MAVFYCSGSAGASVVAHSMALPLIKIAFSTLDCSMVPTCGAWGSATAAKHGPLKQSWAGIQHSRDGEPLGVLMQMRNARVNGFFFFSSLGVLPGVLVDTLWPALCAGLLCCNFFYVLTPVPYHHFFSSLILLFIYVWSLSLFTWCIWYISCSYWQSYITLSEQMF